MSTLKKKTTSHVTMWENCHQATKLRLLQTLQAQFGALTTSLATLLAILLVTFIAW